MMAAIRTTSGPNKAWRAAWMTQSGNAAPRERAPRTMPSPVASASRHPFAEPGIAADLDLREAEIETAFARLAETLEALARQQFEAGFADRAVSALAALDIAADPAWFAADWRHPVDMAAIEARCVVRLFAGLVETGSERRRYACEDGEPVDTLIRRWGFHAVDITPCADGRLAGLLGAVLRIPLSIVTTRRSFAGAMFSVAQSLRDWEAVELGRCRTDRPNPPDAPSRYLKIGVYHFSSLDPAHEGCAAHGGDTDAARDALHDRLRQFRTAVEARHGAGDRVALLLIGLDTDTDAIRVHVPDARGEMQAHRCVDAAELHAQTRDMGREAAKEEVRRAVAHCAGVDPRDGTTEGMRWFCGYLLKNNIAQIEAVLRRHDGPYPVAGHDEKLIVIGDPVDDVQLRNLAFQAQMDSVEEGAADLAVGVRILTKTAPGGVPVLVLKGYDPEIPGDRDASGAAAQRMASAVRSRFGAAPVTVEMALRPGPGGRIEMLDAHEGRAPA